MYIPLPFPCCDRCRRSHSASYHNSGSCHGALEIDPDIEQVHCTGCNKKWNIWDSEYHCNCGNIFTARQIKSAVEDLIEDCRLCAEELRLMDSAYWKRRSLAGDSGRVYVSNTLNSLGYSLGKMAGIAFEKLVDFVMEMFFRRF